MRKLNGKRGPGRPPLCAGEKSVPITVRVSTSDYDFLDKLSKELHLTIPELFRQIPEVLKPLHDENQRLLKHLWNVATPEQRWNSFMRLLSAKGVTETSVDAVKLYLAQYPTDLLAPVIHQTLERFNRANAETPGSFTDDDLWSMLQFGERWREMKERFRQWDRLTPDESSAKV
jgi:hypothetical protein